MMDVKAPTSTEAGASTSPPAGSRLPVLALLAATAISAVGNQITALAIPWLVLQTTGSASKTALTAAVTLVPTVFALFFGGPLVDRAGFRRMSILADAFSGVAVALVPLLSLTIGLSFPGLLALVFLGAIFDAPGSAARSALLPDLAARGGFALARVNSAMGTIHALSALVGPPLAGLLVVALGPRNVLWLDAATFAVSAALVAALVPHVAVAMTTRGSYGQELREGVGFLWRHRLLRAIALTALVVNFLVTPIFLVALPVYADRIFGSARELGLMSSGFGLGALLGAVLYGVLAPHLPGRALFLATMLLLALPLVALATLPGLWGAFALLIGTGLGAGMVNPFVGTVFQERTPAALRGRALGTIQASAMLASPAGILLGGALIERVGLRATILSAALTFLALAAILVFVPALHELDEPAPSQPAPEG